jgi:predicted nucleotidyltransferase
MLNLIENQKAQIVSLCRRYPIERLSVFRSAVRGDLVPGKSDIDFLVQITPCEPGR